MIPHSHCPHGCEHPQPILSEDGKEYCGCHWFKDKVLVEMIPCDSNTCDEIEEEK